MIKILKRVLLTVIGLTAIHSVNAANSELSTVLDAANNLYKQGEFKEAIDKYNSILEGGYESADLYFNLANSYYKNGEATDAIINYERAKLLNPKDEDIAYNLQMANRSVIDKIEAIPVAYIVELYRSSINRHSAEGWGYRALISIIIVLSMIALFYLSSSTRKRRIAFSVAVIALIYSGVTYSFASTQRDKIVNRTGAIITDRTVTVKGSPSETGTELFVIHEGLKVTINDSLGDWREVKLPDGNMGWIHISAITVI